MVAVGRHPRAQKVCRFRVICLHSDAYHALSSDFPIFYFTSVSPPTPSHLIIRLVSPHYSPLTRATLPSSNEDLEMDFAPSPNAGTVDVGRQERAEPDSRRHALKPSSRCPPLLSNLMWRRLQLGYEYSRQANLRAAEAETSSSRKGCLIWSRWRTSLLAFLPFPGADHCSCIQTNSALGFTTTSGALKHNSLSKSVELVNASYNERHSLALRSSSTRFLHHPSCNPNPCRYPSPQPFRLSHTIIQ